MGTAKPISAFILAGLATSGTAAATTVPSSEPPAGELVVVDGRTMHLACVGEGAPVVVFEAGLGAPAETFADVQQSIATTTRTCVYDRAGYGASDPGPEPRTAATIAGELHALLDAAGEDGPFVIAGHSFGGIIGIVFAGAYPDDIAALALLDSSHPGMLAEFEAVPEIMALQDADVEATLEAIPAAGPEYERLATSLDEAAAVGSLGDLPLAVVAHGQTLDVVVPAAVLDAFGITPDVIERYETIWRGLQEDLATLSTASTFVVAESATHYVYLDEPAVVVDAIAALVEQVRASG